MTKHIFIDPSYQVFLNDKLFQLDDAKLNRDNQLLPFWRAKKSAARKNISMNTADFLEKMGENDEADYFSLGITSRYELLSESKNVNRKAFVVMESPMIAPHIYAQLPRITEYFDWVYVHNVEGDGYSLIDVDAKKLRKLYWPMPDHGVIEKYWSCRDRRNKIVVVNGNHKAWGKKSELYSERINAMAELTRFNCIDLYGVGWSQWWSRSSMWPPYYKNYRNIMKIYKGACESKYQVMAGYDFVLCLENMQMNGYVTEKIFDCFYSGAIPIYYGAPDIHEYIPKECMINAREYRTWCEAWRYASSLSVDAREAYRHAAKNFMNSESFKKYTNSIENIILNEL